MLLIKEEKKLTVRLSGEIDHHSAGGMRRRIDGEMLTREPEELILDFSQVSFMDSSAVGLVIGRYKKAASVGCKVAVEGLKERDKKIMLMSGLQNKVEFR